MTIKEVLERIDPVFFMEQKVWIQNQIAELGPSGLEKEAEGILHLLDNLQDVAEEEFNIELGLSETDEVTEYCSKCDREITLPWNVRKDGLKAFCPHCGNVLMLCSYCPATDSESPVSCDYNANTNSCRFKREVS